jgi:multiple antibiotic resistance protein
MELFIYLFAALFSVLNPIGTVPIFVGLTMDDDAKERSKFLCGLLLTYSLF